MSAGRADDAQADWAALVMGWFPELVDTRLCGGDLAGDRCPPRVHRGAAQGWGDAGDDPSTTARRTGSTGQRRVVEAYVAANLPERAAVIGVVVPARSGRRGRGAQIDYGHLGWWLDPATGRRSQGVGVRDWCCAARGTCSSVQCSRWTNALDRGARGGVRVLRRLSARRLVHENVARHIFGVLLPPGYVADAPRAAHGGDRLGRVRPHMAQSEANQSSIAWSVLQIARWREPPRDSTWGARCSGAPSSFALVVISA